MKGTRRSEPESQMWDLAWRLSGVHAHNDSSASLNTAIDAGLATET